MFNRQHQWKLLDNFRRSFFLKNEFKKLIFKTLLKNKYTRQDLRLSVKLKQSFMTTRSSITRHRNRCIVSGRNYNVLRKVKYSRFVFRTKANSGLMPGVSRASR